MDKQVNAWLTNSATWAALLARLDDAALRRQLPAGLAAFAELVKALLASLAQG